MGRISRAIVHTGIFCHNCDDDLNTSEIVLPWADTTEATSFSGRQGFVAPCEMHFISFAIRYEEIDTDHSLTLRIYSTDEGDEVADEEANFQIEGPIEATTDDFTTFYFTEADMGDVTIPKGKNIRLSIQANTDPAASVTWYASSIWEFRLDPV